MTQAPTVMATKTAALKKRDPVTTDQAKVDRALAHCRQSIKVGSLSFSLAASLLGGKTRDAVFMLYGWCRYCDDAIDQLPPETSTSQKLATLSHLRRETEQAYYQIQDNPVFVGLHHIAGKHSIPPYYPLELLAGMEMDLAGYSYETRADLLIYCYRVAGIVGLMSSHILTVKEDTALEQATHMGIAMQITNIARDVFDDFQLGRIYIPRSLLEKHGVDPERICEPSQRPQLVRCVAEMLDWAEELYQSGDRGLIHLPIRMAFAVQVARNVYSDIGRKVRERGPRAWDSRTWIRLPRKLWLTTKAVAQTLLSLPWRALSFFRRAELSQIYTRERAVESAEGLLS